MKSLSRREFLALTATGAVTTMMPFGGCRSELIKSQSPPAARPNILWVSTEDINPDLGCYGDTYAITPNIDRFAAQGIRYTNAFGHAGVCAPVRSGIITGMYPTTIGTCPMRCKGVPPAYVKCFTEYLRAAGYYCSNNSKTDYQFDPPLTAWDESSNRAHWRNRAEGQPFFAVFNFATTHESKIRDRSEKFQKRLAALKQNERHDPAKAPLPPYYPDTPEVRKDRAQYYDTITLMDREFQNILDQLEADGLVDNTIVFFWGDHGRGLPRAKRWIYDSGLHFPLIIRIPEKFRKLAIADEADVVGRGSVNDELVGFIDLGPTALALAGVKIPDYMQGRAFLGPQKAKPREYIFAARDRMDEAYDLIRAVRDKRFKYIRNYMPHLSYGQDIDYMNQMPTMKEMRRLNAEGKLTGPQKHYFRKTKPIEELYDCAADPHEIDNLAEKPLYRDVLKRMRKVHRDWMKETGDVGFIPEPEFDAMKRPGGKWQKTADPQFITVNSVTNNDTFSIHINCPTPGSSIGWRADGNRFAKTGWKLYTQPVSLKAGRTITAKACRIGFNDSRPVTFKVGDIPADNAPAPAPPTEHWRDKIDKTNILQRLMMVKDLDYMPNPIAGYNMALQDRYASVRYWAVIGLHYNCKTEKQIQQASLAIKPLLDDPSPVVRIAAAHALCDFGAEAKALPLLVEELKNNSGSARLHAAIAIGRIGDKACPAVEAIKASAKDRSGYVQRVTKYTLNRLKNCK